MWRINFCFACIVNGEELFLLPFSRISPFNWRVISVQLGLYHESDVCIDDSIVTVV